MDMCNDLWVIIILYKLFGYFLILTQNRNLNKNYGGVMENWDDDILLQLSPEFILNKSFTILKSFDQNFKKFGLVP